MAGLKRMQLITKKDRCNVFDTRTQTEVECGIRMLAYMVIFRSMDLQDLRVEEIIERIKNQVATEKGFSGDLAERRRKNIHRLLQIEQAKVKK